MVVVENDLCSRMLVTWAGSLVIGAGDQAHPTFTGKLTLKEHDGYSLNLVHTSLKAFEQNKVARTN